MLDTEKTDMNLETTLVLGGTGKTGRRVAQQLIQAGHAVRIGSRSAATPFDWDDRDTWAPVLRGVRAAYVSYQPDLAVPGALQTVAAFFTQALDSGIEKLVLLSGRGEAEALDAEAALRATRADWTILRASWFHQNFSEGFWLDSIRAGEVALPATLAAEPFVDVDDIADIAVEALTTSRHSKQLYELTGPEALTFSDAFGQIAQAAGRSITLIPVSIAEYRAELVRQGLPQAYVDLVIYLFENVLDGRNTPITDGVQRALGRSPRSFADFVKNAAATGVWGQRVR
jgi:uncharacterized protein YbjT (DUF2867 family)